MDQVNPGASAKSDFVLPNHIKSEPIASTSSMVFGTEDVIYGSTFDVFQEVIVEEEIQDINVENSRSNSPISVANESNSNENSVSSFTNSETQNKYWTREDLTPSDVLPDNLFTENEDDYNIDQGNIDTTININNETGFSLKSLFPIKEEPLENEQSKCTENGTEQVKKVVKRKIKQEPTDSAPPNKYVF